LGLEDSGLGPRASSPIRAVAPQRPRQICTAKRLANPWCRGQCAGAPRQPSRGFV